MDKNILFKFIFIASLILTTLDCFTQRIEKVHPEIEGEKIRIYYDLTGIEADQSVMVTVFMSTDGGKTYGNPLKSVTGDVGVMVGPGENRCIIWDVFKDVDELVSVNVKFKVKADLQQSGQNIPVTDRKIKLDLNTNLGFKSAEAFDSKSFGFNLKGVVYLNRLGLGLRGDYFKNFGDDTELPDSGYYRGYTGGAVMEYDLLQDKKYSLYPFVYVGSAKVLYEYDSEYHKDGIFTYSIFGTAGIGFDINIVKFLYLGVELEYFLSPWLEIHYTKVDEYESLDGLSIGFIIKFILNPD